MNEYPENNQNGDKENEVFASDMADQNNPGGASDPGAFGNPPYGGDQKENAAAPESSPYGGNVQYQWNYDDYQKALNDQKKPENGPKKKNKGLRAFLISVGSVLAIAVISLAAVGITALVRNGGVFGSTGSANPSGDKVINSNAPTLTLNNKPNSSSSSASGTTASPLQMSASQVYNSLKSSVVTIETFDMQQSLDPTAEGSGIVISADGYIVTNEHVIDGAKNISVVLSNQKQYTAKLVGSDLRTDLAVIKIDASGLTPAKFGNSDQLSVAEQVLAIGNPGGLEFSGSVTEGIVSAVNRAVTTESGYTENCIQTDAPINPGNSGGALVNMYGQVVGITSSKIEDTGYEGMGFAIPINTAQPIINDIIKYGYVTGRVKLGIEVNQFTSYQASMYGYPAGLIVENVDSGSDAVNKLQQEDIITKIDGVSITTYDQFYAQESKHKVGESVSLTVFRHSTGNTFTVSVKLQEDKGNTASSSSQSSQNNNNNSNNYGFGYGQQDGNGSGSPFNFNNG